MTVLLDTDEHLTADDLIDAVTQAEERRRPFDRVSGAAKARRSRRRRARTPWRRPRLLPPARSVATPISSATAATLSSTSPTARSPGLARKVDEAHGFAPRHPSRRSPRTVRAMPGRGRHLTEMAIDSEAPPETRERGFLPIPDVKAWRSIYASRGDEPRNRRAADAVLFVFAAAGLLIASLIANSELEGEANAIAAIQDLFDWLDPVWRVDVCVRAALRARADRRRLRHEASSARLHAADRSRARHRHQRDGRSSRRRRTGPVSSRSSSYGETTFPPMRIAVCTAVIATSASRLVPTDPTFRRGRGHHRCVRCRDPRREHVRRAALGGASVGILVAALIYSRRSARMPASRPTAVSAPASPSSGSPSASSRRPTASS